jgi:hypothetical protein
VEVAYDLEARYPGMIRDEVPEPGEGTASMVFEKRD